ncbi:MAG: hypothetical protein JO148_08755, partial [Acidimicrobiia bacterium]|nr:hypothetical protein [Acidimicrobiia bacterium]
AEDGSSLTPIGPTATKAASPQSAAGPGTAPATAKAPAAPNGVLAETGLPSGVEAAGLAAAAVGAALLRTRRPAKSRHECEEAPDL